MLQIQFLVVLATSVGVILSKQPPHIIFIVADDMGWNDVSWNNPAIFTPNLERLATNGIILNQSYVQPLCTPSRSALMTGYYPFRMGRQNQILKALSPAGVPLRFTYLPEVLKDAGYVTHMIGKWHLGFCSWAYTPTWRGFDTFFGFYTGSEDYFSHMRTAVSSKPDECKHCENTAETATGLDLRNNTRPCFDYEGSYSTDLFGDVAEKILVDHSPEIPIFLYISFQSPHAPLQVPKMYEDMYSHIKDDKRRKYSGMMTAMDDAIGRVFYRLEEHGFIDNCVIVFTTDNGGQVTAGGSNWPLRGNKGTLWEGGTRGPAFFWSSRMKNAGYVSNNLFHIVDWFPTLSAAAGVNSGIKFDGINQWKMLIGESDQMRNEIIYNIFDSPTPRGAIRIGDYKLIQGFPGNPSGWIIPEDGYHDAPSMVCTIQRNDSNHRPQVRLYNLAEDPLETKNIALEHPDIVAGLLERLDELRTEMVPTWDPPVDILGSPEYWGGAFSPGWCEAVV